MSKKQRKEDNITPLPSVNEPLPETKSGLKSVQNKSQNDDVHDFDQDLKQLPPPEDDKDILDAPIPQPNFDDSDEDEAPTYVADKKFALLYDLVLTKAESDEKFDEWSYKSLIQELEDEEPQKDSAQAISVISPDNSLLDV